MADDQTLWTVRLYMKSGRVLTQPNVSECTYTDNSLGRSIKWKISDSHLGERLMLATIALGDIEAISTEPQGGIAT